MTAAGVEPPPGLRRTPRGWPFFAPTQETAIAEALDLADLRPGDHFADLGCGEGHVLVAAARRGALVTGVECDRSLAGTAREALAEAGLPGEVVVGDLFDPALYGEARPDVLFAYLSPATLQRLTPVLGGFPGSRLVTVDFDVPDLVPDVTRGGARLYHLPGTPRGADPGPSGWPAAGTLCVMPPDVNSLTSLEVVHPGGLVDVSLRGNAGRHAALATGCDNVQPHRPVAVDLRWRERPAGTLAQGAVAVRGLWPHPLTVLFAEDDQGQWDLSPDGVADLDRRLRRRSLPRPVTTREILDALE